MKTLALYRPYGIGKALEDFDRYMESFFGESPLTPAASRRLPAVDIQETPEGYLLEADLPGFEEKDIQVETNGGMLTIESIRKEEKAEDANRRFLLRERSDVSFRRTFQLPDNADAAGVQARFKNGTLYLDIKKRPEAQKRRIEISSGE